MPTASATPTQSLVNNASSFYCRASDEAVEWDSRQRSMMLRV